MGIRTSALGENDRHYIAKCREGHEDGHHFLSLLSCHVTEEDSSHNATGAEHFFLGHSSEVGDIDEHV